MQLYLAGQASQQQAKRLSALLEQESDALHLIENEMQEVWSKELRTEEDSSGIDEGLQKVWEKIYAENGDISIRTSRRNNRWLGYAAAISFLFAVGVFMFLRSERQAQTVLGPKWVTRSTKVGEKVKILLPDSSVVFLNAMSTLRYADDFGMAKSREIYLNGQAFFDVKSKVNKPFIVHTDKVLTTVLGTSFDISAYTEEEQIRVSVKTGKVKVSKWDGHLLHELSELASGMQLVYQKSSTVYMANTARVADFGAWSDNRFVFRNEPLKDILKTLTRNYKTKFFVVGQNLDSCRFNASFNNKNIKQIMDQLHIMSGGNITYNFSREGQQITIKGKGCE
ncbi:FecR domain-containing protein [Olivibacter sp. CPCC 100613]|uniref:FecR family protein n=1 Tax=Olivibacter sp. CPCC 100613 TaxID=3079931 RepID=UPI002FFA38F2